MKADYIKIMAGFILVALSSATIIGLTVYVVVSCLMESVGSFVLTFPLVIAVLVIYGGHIKKCVKGIMKLFTL